MSLTKPYESALRRTTGRMYYRLESGYWNIYLTIKNNRKMRRINRSRKVSFQYLDEFKEGSRFIDAARILPHTDLLKTALSIAPIKMKER